MIVSTLLKTTMLKEYDTMTLFIRFNVQLVFEEAMEYCRLWRSLDLRKLL
jgi:hypothetical protein